MAAKYPYWQNKAFKHGWVTPGGPYCVYDSQVPMGLCRNGDGCMRPTVRPGLCAVHAAKPVQGEKHNPEVYKPDILEVSPVGAQFDPVSGCLSVMK